MNTKDTSTKTIGNPSANPSVSGQTDVGVADCPLLVHDVPWITLVWNDPINLMSYVSYVFRQVFGYSEQKADHLMREVHHQGKAVVSSGPREHMEGDAVTLQGYGLWATFQHTNNC